jgi:hypothetical protein
LKGSKILNVGDVKMGDEVFNTAVGTMGFYTGLLQEIIKEYGWEKCTEK